MSPISYMVIGVIVVFFGFAILFVVFKIMELLAKGKPKKKIQAAQKVEEKVEEKKQQSDDEAEVVAIAAALSEVLSKPITLTSQLEGKTRIYSFEERFISWRKSGWKGVRKWRASSGW
ncbi:OadG family protein [Pseudothermotoga thermarum]|uniref:Sodium pump decarboxylase gamma subunit n=1 Tax=Pseudothermotoga thermarum DSM 5069 TaxID=688269 RepID=F7YV95_9THEM|nr:OadG family protein [Pseudothermotoga thermarum]AEH50395.1 sodium pump decarboxylase gamma subunit [Pseudothermotoga thermarum DSM 5069]